MSVLVMSNADQQLFEEGKPNPTWFTLGIWSCFFVSILLGFKIAQGYFKRLRLSAPREARDDLARIRALNLQLPRIPSNPREFEFVTRDWILAWGGQGVGITQTSNDGGIDVYSDELVGQCKMLSSRKVGRPELQNLYGAAASNGGLRALVFFAWSLGYTTHAVEYAEANRIALFLFQSSSGQFHAANSYATGLLAQIGVDTVASSNASNSAAPADWYPDPSGRFELRYWNGSMWTEHVLNNGQQFIDTVASSNASNSAAPADWYPDPSGRFELRYWNGSMWTEHVLNNGQQFIDTPVP